MTGSRLVLDELWVPDDRGAFQLTSPKSEPRSPSNDQLFYLFLCSKSKSKDPGSKTIPK